MVYLRNYLSVMFNISDVMIDKEELPVEMQLPIHITEDTCLTKTILNAFQNLLLTNKSSFHRKAHTRSRITHQSHCSPKVAEILEIQGISCCRCPKNKVYNISLYQPEG